MTPRQRRCLALLLNGPASTMRIIVEAGTTGPSALVSRLRRQGVGITCAMRSARDRDGNAIRVGEYRLHDRRAARRLLGAK